MAQELPAPLTAISFRVAASLFAAAFVVFANLYDAQPLLPLFRSVFHANEAVVSLAIALSVLGVAAASLLVGPISDRWGRKNLMVLSTFLLALPTFAAAWAPNIETFLVARTFTGLFLPGVIAVVIAYVNEEYRPPASHFLMGLYVGSTVVGGLVGRIGAGLLAATWGWRPGFVLIGAVTVAVAITLAFSLPASRRFRSTPSFSSSLKNLFLSFTDPTLLALGFLGFSYFFAFLSSFTFMTYYLADPPFRLSQVTISLIFFTYIFGIVASPLAGKMSGRFGPFPVVGVGILLLLTGTLLTLVPNLAVIVGALCVITFGQFTAQALTPALAGQVASHGRGAAGGLYTVLYYVGGSLGSSIPGWLWPRFHYPGVVALDALCLLLALGFWNYARRRVGEAR